MKKGDGVSKESRLLSRDTNQVRGLEGLHKELATPHGRQEIFRTQLTHESPRTLRNQGQDVLSPIHYAKPQYLRPLKTTRSIPREWFVL